MATQRELAKHLCTNEHRVRDLVNVGVLPKPLRGQGYNLDECRQVYIRHLEKLAVKDEDAETKRERQKTVDDIQKERARQAAETADKLALENAARRRELVPVTVLSEAVQQVATLVRSNLESLPAECKRQLPFLNNSQLGVIRRVVARVSDDIASIDLSHTGPA